MTRSQIAARLARMGRGVPKKFSPEEIRKRTQRLLKAAKAYRAKLKKAKKKTRK